MAVIAGLVRHEAGPAVVMVNAPWGAGKTTFLRMCTAEFGDRPLVVEFNSWTQQYTKSPLTDLISAVSYRLQAKEWEAARDLEGYADPLSQLFSRSRGGRFSFGSWNTTQESVREFSGALHRVATNHGPIVLVVDELDRCQPAYALATLETLHHLFAVEGVIALVGVSRDALTASIQSIYGEQFDADTYLRRFADLLIDLPPPDPDKLPEFLNNQLESIGLAGRIRPSSTEILQLVAEIGGGSLRDLQQAVRLAALALAANPPDPHPAIIWEHSVMAMIVLRMADQEAYRQFVRGDIGSLDALAATNAKLPPYPDITAQPIPTPPRRYWFEAALLNIVSKGDPIDTANVDWFRPAYLDAHRDKRKYSGIDIPIRIGASSDQTGAILTELAMLRRHYAAPPGWAPVYVDHLARRLDLLASDQEQLA